MPANSTHYTRYLESSDLAFGLRYGDAALRRSRLLESVVQRTRFHVRGAQWGRSASCWPSSCQVEDRHCIVFQQPDRNRLEGIVYEMLPSKENGLEPASEVVGVPEAHAEVFPVAGELRTAESVVLGFLVYTTVASLELPMSARERVTITALNTLAGAVIFLLEKATQEKPRGFVVAVRDWLPAPLILLAYRESGMFFIPDPAHRLDHMFVRWDCFLLQNKWVLATLSGLAPWPQVYLELAYLFCYPLVPLGLGCLLLAQRKSETRNSKLETRQSKIQNLKSKIVVDHFWTAVLIATLFCYAVYPFFPLTPPRLLFHDLPGPPVPAFIRTANLWLLGNYGVPACIFPSGHVAAVTATALAVHVYRPRLGALFLVAAASVAVATVLLRYHYAADALAGVLVGCSAFAISGRIHCRQE
jgi:membrane-associated phospholipid phosphatase